jgi:phosphoenolpyruvate carboxykinase (ATP)
VKKHGIVFLQEICLLQPVTGILLKNLFLILPLLAVPGFKLDPKIDGTRTETAIILNFANRTAMIANSLYGGEIKKSIFTVLNFFLHFRMCFRCIVLQMLERKGDAALFLD